MKKSTDHSRVFVTSRGVDFAGRLGLLHARTRLPLVLGALSMTVLSLQRLWIWASLHDRFVDASWGEQATAFLTGLRFDLVITAMLMVPLFPLLFFTPPALMRRKAFKTVAAGYAGVAFGVLMLLCISDYYFFQEFGERLNHKVLHYLTAPDNGYLYHTIAEQFPLWPALGLTVVVAAAACAFMARFGFDDRYNVGPVWQAVAWPTLFGVMTAVAIRGSLSSHAINVGPAYFSDSAPLAQLTLNGAFTLRQATYVFLTKQYELDRLYRLLPLDRAEQIIHDLAWTDRDRPVAQPNNVLHRRTDTGDPRRDLNVVLVVLESMSWHYVGAMGGEGDLTPHLDALAGDGLLFDNCFAVGGRTERGFAGVLAGFPDLPYASVTTRNETLGRFITLGDVLARRDYRTMFVYGGPAHRDHRQSFLGSNGFGEFVTEDALQVRSFRTDLGWCDDDMFASANKHLASLDHDRPFFATLLTLSFHRPYALPDAPFPQVDPTDPHADQLNAVRYTDWAIGRFMAKARQSDYYHRTLFVFVADHSGGYREQPKDMADYRVPFLIYGEPLGDLHGRRISTLCSQMDVAPTILNLLGGEYEHCFFGSSVIERPAERGLAFTLFGDNSLMLMNSDRQVVVVPVLHSEEPKTFLYAPPHTLQPAEIGDAATRTMTERSLAIIQTADSLFRAERYNIGPRR